MERRPRGVGQFFPAIVQRSVGKDGLNARKVSHPGDGRTAETGGRHSKKHKPRTFNDRLGYGRTMQILFQKVAVFVNAGNAKDA